MCGILIPKQGTCFGQRARVHAVRGGARAILAQRSKLRAAKAHGNFGYRKRRRSRRCCTFESCHFDQIKTQVMIPLVLHLSFFFYALKALWHKAFAVQVQKISFIVSKLTTPKSKQRDSNPPYFGFTKSQ